MEIVRSSKKGNLLILLGFQSGALELFLFQKPADLTNLDLNSVMTPMGLFLAKNKHPISKILYNYQSKLIYAITQEGDLFLHKLRKQVSSRFL